MRKEPPWGKSGKEKPEDRDPENQSGQGLSRAVAPEPHPRPSDQQDKDRDNEDQGFVRMSEHHSPERAHGGAVTAYLPVKRYQYPEARKRQARIAEGYKGARAADETVDKKREYRVDENNAEGPYTLLPHAHVEIRNLALAHEIEDIGRRGEHEEEHEKRGPEELGGVVDRVGAENHRVENHKRG